MSPRGQEGHSGSSRCHQPGCFSLLKAATYLSGPVVGLAFFRVYQIPPRASKPFEVCLLGPQKQEPSRKSEAVTGVHALPCHYLGLFAITDKRNMPNGISRPLSPHQPQQALCTPFYPAPLKTSSLGRLDLSRKWQAPTPVLAQQLQQACGRHKIWPACIPETEHGEVALVCFEYGS